MPKKPPEPTTLTGPAGQTYTITVTERGLRIEVDERWRIVYTSLITDNARNIRFEVEATRGKKPPQGGLPKAGV